MAATHRRDARAIGEGSLLRLRLLLNSHLTLALTLTPTLTQARVANALASSALGSSGAAGDGTRLLSWATWAVLSRVLTVQGPAPLGGLGGGAPAGRKLLIPFIDMFNHKAGTKHYLTGRTDGMLKVVAGQRVRAGEQIFIKYGTDATANDEFVAHYGFHDPSATDADRALVAAFPEALPALAATTASDDEALLAAEPPPPYTEQLAIRLRLSLKRAAVAEGLL